MSSLTPLTPADAAAPVATTVPVAAAAATPVTTELLQQQLDELVRQNAAMMRELVQLRLEVFKPTPQQVKAHDAALKAADALAETLAKAAALKVEMDPLVTAVQTRVQEEMARLLQEAASKEETAESSSTVTLTPQASRGLSARADLNGPSPLAAGMSAFR